MPLETREYSYGWPDEIFIVENDGQVRQLTHLYDTFGMILTIDSISWSPDGKKIAFWLHDGQGNLTLMVANSLTGEVKNYCILNATVTRFPIDVSAPIWSPDGKYLLVENRYTADKSKLLVVDLLNNIAFPIAEMQNAVGWMLEN
jgi:Tol biopolymer transport system component